MPIFCTYCIIQHLACDTCDANSAADLPSLLNKANLAHCVSYHLALEQLHRFYSVHFKEPIMSLQLVKLNHPNPVKHLIQIETFGNSFLSNIWENRSSFADHSIFLME
jgi:hypothetical protein